MDKITRNQIIMLILGAMISATALLSNSMLLWNTQMFNEKKVIAKSFSVEISTLKDYLIQLDGDFSNESLENEIFIQETPFYYDNGMYYILQRDIFRLDYKSSYEIYMFYTNLFIAEQNRRLIFEIQRKGDVRDLTIAEKYRQKMLTNTTKQAINNSVLILSELEIDLLKNT